MLSNCFLINKYKKKSDSQITISNRNAKKTEFLLYCIGILASVCEDEVELPPHCSRNKIKSRLFCLICFNEKKPGRKPGRIRCFHSPQSLCYHLLFMHRGPNIVDGLPTRSINVHLLQKISNAIFLGVY